MRTRILVLALPACAVALLAAQPSNLPRAIAAQEQILAARPADPEAYNDYGNLMLLAGLEEPAEAAYERAVTLDPGLVSARYNLALLLEQRGALKAARRQIDAVLELRPDHAWAHFQKGRILERQGRTRAAVGAYAEAFLLRPELSFAEVNPQVLDSDLVTRALLETRPGIRGASEAPRIYEDPTRIATLLLPRLPSQASGDASEDDQAVPPLLPSEPGPTDTVPAPAETNGRVLHPGDLPEGSRVGEATPAVPATRTPEARSNVWLQQQQRLQRRNAPPTTPGTATGGDFRPGSRSTGQSRLQIRQDG